MTRDVGLALREGVRLASGLRLAPHDVACALYGDAFSDAEAQRAQGAQVPAPREHDAFEGFEGFETGLLTVRRHRSAGGGPAVRSPGDAEAARSVLLRHGSSRVLQREGVREALIALGGSRFFASFGDHLLISDLKQVRRYLNEPSVRREVRSRVAARITEDTRVLVAHSMGSVVAYEAMCEHPEWPVTDLVSLGSPLGFPRVFDRLAPLPADGRGVWPGRALRWTNISDPGDIVALVHRLAPHFGDRVVDRAVSNGTAPHELTRYLTAVTTGQAVASGLVAAEGRRRSAASSGTTVRPWAADEAP